MSSRTGRVLSISVVIETSVLDYAVEMLTRPGRVIADASGVGYRGLAGAEAYGATQARQINLLEAVRVLPATGWSAAHPIVFPARMAILMKVARFVPVENMAALFAALWRDPGRSRDPRYVQPSAQPPS